MLSRDDLYQQRDALSGQRRLQAAEKEIDRVLYQEVLHGWYATWKGGPVPTIWVIIELDSRPDNDKKIIERLLMKYRAGGWTVRASEKERKTLFIFDR